MQDRIRATYERATDDELARGRAWYPLARTIVTEISKRTGVEPLRVAMALAALSPQNPWRWNVADAANYAAAFANGEPMPVATTFGVNQRRAWAILNGDPGWTTKAPKVNCFVANIMGDPNEVTVDTWATRIAVDLDQPKSDGQYKEIADAYRDVAVEVNELPCDLQAITWLVAQREAAPNRTAVARTFKKNTLPYIQELLS